MLQGRKGDKKSKKHKHKKKKHHHKKSKVRSDSSSSSSSSSADEWVEKQPPEPPKQKRDDWMSLASVIPTVSQADRRGAKETDKQTKQQCETYDPNTSALELNPYWKAGGDGLPSTRTKFKRPADRDDPGHRLLANRRSGWRKPSDEARTNTRGRDDGDKGRPSNSVAPDVEANRGRPAAEDLSDEQLTDSEMNLLAAKIIRAEILGDARLAAELGGRLERARQLRRFGEGDDVQGGGSGAAAAALARHLPDDERRMLEHMFSRERGERRRQDAEVVRAASRLSRGDHLDDLFEAAAAGTAPRAPRSPPAASAAPSFEDCARCPGRAPPHLTAWCGELAYVSVPAAAPLADGQCAVVPVRHVRSCRLLDEDEWAEVQRWRRALVDMCDARGLDAVFFETARGAAHAALHCVPVARDRAAAAPMYFRKAIEECETEWALNRKLVSLADRDLRRAVPRGLPYFYVAFGMRDGFAHVIEDPAHFPAFFAQEVLGGMLRLHHSTWRRTPSQPRELQERRVQHLSAMWREWSESQRAP